MSSLLIIVVLSVLACPGLASPLALQQSNPITSLFWSSINDLTDFWNALMRSDVLTLMIKAIDIKMNMTPPPNRGGLVDYCLYGFKKVLLYMRPMYYKMFPKQMEVKSNVMHMSNDTANLLNDQVVKQSINTAIQYMNSFKNSDMFKGIMGSLFGNN